MLFSTIKRAFGSGQQQFSGFQGRDVILVDLSTDTTWIMAPGMTEPRSYSSMVYVEENADVNQKPADRIARIRKFGDSARAHWELCPVGYSTLRLLKNGAITHMAETEEYLRLIAADAAPQSRVRWMRRKPFVVVSQPTMTTQVQQDQRVECIMKAFNTTFVGVVDQALMTGIYAGAGIDSPEGFTVIDIGGGTANLGIYILLSPAPGGRMSLTNVAGDALNEAIITYVKNQFEMKIGTPTAEAVKKELGWATQPVAKRGQPLATMTISGTSLANGTKQTDINSLQVFEAMQPCLIQITTGIKRGLDNIGAEQVSKLIQSGVYVGGGTARLRDLAARIWSDLGLRTSVVDHPDRAVIGGMMKVAEDPTTLGGAITDCSR